MGEWAKWIGITILVVVGLIAAAAVAADRWFNRH